MLKNRVIYLTILALLGLFRIAYTGYVAGMLLLLALILPIFSWLLSLPGAIYTKVSISAPDQVARGSDAAVVLNIRQSRLFATGPALGVLYLNCPVTGAVTRVPLRAHLNEFPLDTSSCCRYHCEIHRFRVLDLMGLFPLPVKAPGEVLVSVMPLPQEPPEHPDWAGSSMLINKPFTGGENPYDLRDYRTGDTLKAVHWKKSAALDKTVVRDTLEPVERVAPIWLDWTADGTTRDAALDQLAWCIVYLKQNQAGILVQWKDADNATRQIFATQGELDTVLHQILEQPAGKDVPTSQLQPREILLSGGVGRGAST